ncbi:unnamed protein product [Ixodes pacificus]
MMFLVLMIGATMTGFCVASTQTPTLTSCSTAQQVKLSNVVITNARLGQTMTLNFTVNITTTLNTSPQLKVTMTTNFGLPIPCINDVGSCAYDLCGGTSEVEQGLGSRWNNTCPITPNSYTESLTAALPTDIKFLLGNGNIKIKLNILNGGQSVGCQQFTVSIQLN